MKKPIFYFGLFLFLVLLWSGLRAGIETTGDIKTTGNQISGTYTNSEVLAAGSGISMTRANGTNTVANTAAAGFNNILIVNRTAEYMITNAAYNTIQWDTVEQNVDFDVSVTTNGTFYVKPPANGTYHVEPFFVIDCSSDGVWYVQLATNNVSCGTCQQRNGSAVSAVGSSYCQTIYLKTTDQLQFQIYGGSGTNYWGYSGASKPRLAIYQVR